MEQPEAATGRNESPQTPTHLTSTCIDWYSEGQSRTVECNGVRVTIRFVGRKGRRCRIVIEAPGGVVFRMGRD
jgi:hypothetical protein